MAKKAQYIKTAPQIAKIAIIDKDNMSTEEIDKSEFERTYINSNGLPMVEKLETISKVISIDGTPAYYTFNVLDSAVTRFNNNLLLAQELVDSIDLTRPFHEFTQAIGDEVLVQARHEFLAFLKTDFPEAVTASIPYFEQLNTLCTDLNTNLQNLFMGFSQAMGEVVIAFSETFPVIVEVLQAMWDGFYNINQIGLNMMTGQYSYLFQVMKDLFTKFTGISTVDWQSFWDGVVKLAVNAAQIIVNEVFALVNSVIEQLNFLLGAINSVAGKLGFDLNLNIPTLDNNHFVANTGLSLVNDGESLLSQKITEAGQAVQNYYNTNFVVNNNGNKEVLYRDIMDRVNTMMFGQPI